MLIAIKCKEIFVLPMDDFVFMTEKGGVGYTKEEILKGERTPYCLANPGLRGFAVLLSV